MPEISRFLGIIIYMYFDEHPPPHFHARYGSYEILVYLDDGLWKAGSQGVPCGTY